MQTTAVALSGGVDSMVAAYLLKKSGRPVFGIHFLSGYETPEAEDVYKGEYPDSGILDLPKTHPLSALKDMLGIEIWALDCRRTFRKKIVESFIDAYLKGETPNPCMVCNFVIKFGLMLEAARQKGASQLATGHYAICEKLTQNRYGLKKGHDKGKEQSYFLAMLSQTQLAHAYFPLGRLTKEGVSRIAASNKLEPVSGHESQDICFIKNMHYSHFLAEHAGLEPAPGEIVDVHGRYLGQHQGLYRYTIGQRRGINSPSTEPYYVIRLDTKNNRLVVGFKKDLYRYECKIHRVNWMRRRPEKSMHVMTKIRYRHDPAPSEIIPTGQDTAMIRFSRPQPAVTPGQAAVCYEGDQLAAGGWIYD